MDSDPPPRQHPDETPEDRGVLVLEQPVVGIPRQAGHSEPEPVTGERDDASSATASPVSASPDHLSTAPDETLESQPRRSERRGPRDQMSLCVAWIAGLCLLVVLVHRFVPDLYGAGSLLDTTLPWLVVPLAVLFVWALLLWRRAAIAVTALALVAWAVVDGCALLPRGSQGAADVSLVSQNISMGAPGLAALGQLAEQRHATVLALQTVSAATGGGWAAQRLDSAYPYHVVMYGFGVWSTYPISSAGPVLLNGTGTTVDALRLMLDTPKGMMTLYDVHLPPPTLNHDGFARTRNKALRALVAALGTEHAGRLVVVGDLNVAATDRAMGELVNGTLRLRSAQREAGSGFGFTWPASLPMVRLDDALVRGLTTLRTSVLPHTTSGGDHRPILVDLRF